MSLCTLQLTWPQNKAFGAKILPIFIPFAGCERRCIFCAQHIQSGTLKESVWQNFPTTQATAPLEKVFAKTVLAQAQKQLEQLHQQQENTQQDSCLPEIAFYGGTFTALPQEDFQLCCDFVQSMRQNNKISHARCSTRPDCITPQRLKIMKEVGFRCIELGVQSFNNAALTLAQRHYTEEDIIKACKRIHDAGFTVGIQLMPGMPGVSPNIFLEDVTKALQMQAHFLRFYPCQVIAGTELARLWQAGSFIPWELAQTIETVSQGWLQAHLAKVPVIRMGLAPEQSLEAHILAGPRHPALGSKVQGLALYTHIKNSLEQKSSQLKKDNVSWLSIQQCKVPRTCQGYFWGHKKNLEDAWMRLGVQKDIILWHDKPIIELIYIQR